MGHRTKRIRERVGEKCEIRLSAKSYEGLGCEVATKRNVYIGLRLLYVWGKFVYVRGTIDLRTEGCTFTRVAFFVCVWVNPMFVGV